MPAQRPRLRPGGGRPGQAVVGEAQPDPTGTGLLRVPGGLPPVVAGLGGALVAPAPGGPAQPVASAIGGLDDQGGGQAADLVTGQRETWRRWQLEAVGASMGDSES